MPRQPKAPPRRREAAPAPDRPPPNPRWDLHAAKARKAAERPPAGPPVELPPGSNISSDPRLRRLVEQHVEMVEKAKALFDESDVVLDSILAICGNARVVQLDLSRVAVIVDQFEAKNVVWRSHACRRYVVSILGGEKASKRPPPPPAGA